MQEVLYEMAAGNSKAMKEMKMLFEYINKICNQKR